VTFRHSRHSLTLRRSPLLPPLNSRSYAILARALVFQARDTWKPQMNYAVFWNALFKTIHSALLSLPLRLLRRPRWSSVRHLKTHKSHFPTPLHLSNPSVPSQHVLYRLICAIIAHRPALVEGNVSKLPRLDVPVLCATVGRQSQEKVIKLRQITGQGKAANEKISAGKDCISPTNVLLLNLYQPFCPPFWYCHRHRLAYCWIHIVALRHRRPTVAKYLAGDRR
jgi:hypothetical protein